MESPRSLFEKHMQENSVYKEPGVWNIYLNLLQKQPPEVFYKMLFKIS